MVRSIESRETCGTLNDNYHASVALAEAAIFGLRLRKLISWLLILIFLSSPFQASVAMHIDLTDSDQDRQALIEQSREIAFVNDKQNCIVNFCQVFSACAAHLNCNPISSSRPPQLDAHAQFFYHGLTGAEPASTRFGQGWEDYVREVPRFVPHFFKRGLPHE